MESTAQNWPKYFEWLHFFQLPNLIVVNTSSYQHFLPNDEPIKMTPEAIALFIDSILEGEAPVYGGSSYTVRYYHFLINHTFFLREIKFVFFCQALSSLLRGQNEYHGNVEG